MKVAGKDGDREYLILVIVILAALLLYQSTSSNTNRVVGGFHATNEPLAQGDGGASEGTPGEGIALAKDQRPRTGSSSTETNQKQKSGRKVGPKATRPPGSEETPEPEPPMATEIVGDDTVVVGADTIVLAQKGGTGESKNKPVAKKPSTNWMKKLVVGGKLHKKALLNSVDAFVAKYDRVMTKQDFKRQQQEQQQQSNTSTPLPPIKLTKDKPISGCTKNCMGPGCWANSSGHCFKSPYYPEYESLGQVFSCPWGAQFDAAPLPTVDKDILDPKFNNVHNADTVTARLKAFQYFTGKTLTPGRFYPWTGTCSLSTGFSQSRSGDQETSGQKRNRKKDADEDSTTVQIGADPAPPDAGGGEDEPTEAPRSAYQKMLKRRTPNAAPLKSYVREEEQSPETPVAPKPGRPAKRRALTPERPAEGEDGGGDLSPEVVVVATKRPSRNQQLPTPRKSKATPNPEPAPEDYGEAAPRSPKRKSKPPPPAAEGDDVKVEASDTRRAFDIQTAVDGNTSSGMSSRGTDDEGGRMPVVSGRGFHVQGGPRGGAGYQGGKTSSGIVPGAQRAPRSAGAQANYGGSGATEEFQFTAKHEGKDGYYRIRNFCMSPVGAMYGYKPRVSRYDGRDDVGSRVPGEVNSAEFQQWIDSTKSLKKPAACYLDTKVLMMPIWTRTDNPVHVWHRVAQLNHIKEVNYGIEETNVVTAYIFTQEYALGFAPPWPSDPMYWLNETAFSGYLRAISPAHFAIYATKKVKPAQFRAMGEEWPESTLMSPMVCFREAIVYHTCLPSDCQASKTRPPPRPAYNTFHLRSASVLKAFTNKLRLCVGAENRPAPRIHNPKVILAHRTRTRRWVTAPYLQAIIGVYVEKVLNGSLFVNEMGGTPTPDLVAMFADADIVIGQYGSGLAYSVLMPPGAVMIEVNLNGYYCAGHCGVSTNTHCDYGGDMTAAGIHHVVGSIAHNTAWVVTAMSGTHEDISPKSILHLLEVARCIRNGKPAGTCYRDPRHAQHKYTHNDLGGTLFRRISRITTPPQLWYRDRNVVKKVKRSPGAKPVTLSYADEARLDYVVRFADRFPGLRGGEILLVGPCGHSKALLDEIDVFLSYGIRVMILSIPGSWELQGLIKSKYPDAPTPKPEAVPPAEVAPAAAPPLSQRGGRAQRLTPRPREMNVRRNVRPQAAGQNEYEDAPAAPRTPPPKSPSKAGRGGFAPSPKSPAALPPPEPPEGGAPPQAQQQPGKRGGLPPVRGKAPPSGTTTRKAAKAPPPSSPTGGGEANDGGGGIHQPVEEKLAAENDLIDLATKAPPPPTNPPENLIQDYCFYDRSASLAAEYKKRPIGYCNFKNPGAQHCGGRFGLIISSDLLKPSAMKHVEQFARGLGSSAAAPAEDDDDNNHDVKDGGVSTPDPQPYGDRSPIIVVPQIERLRKKYL